MIAHSGQLVDGQARSLPRCAATLAPKETWLTAIAESAFSSFLRLTRTNAFTYSCPPEREDTHNGYDSSSGYDCPSSVGFHATSKRGLAGLQADGGQGPNCPRIIACFNGPLTPG